MWLWEQCSLIEKTPALNGSLDEDVEMSTMRSSVSSWRCIQLLICATRWLAQLSAFFF